MTNKKTLYCLIIFAIFLIIPALSSGQNTTTIGKSSEKEKKISYAFINEYGISIGGAHNHKFGVVELSGVIVNGIRFNSTQDEIGIGIGLGLFFLSTEETTFPIFLNYRHYIRNNKKIKPLINVAAGIQLGLSENIDNDMGLYSTLATGFKSNAFSLTLGIFVKTCDGDLYSGLEIKAGFTF